MKVLGEGRQWLSQHVRDSRIRGYLLRRATGSKWSQIWRGTMQAANVQGQHCLGLWKFMLYNHMHRLWAKNYRTQHSPSFFLSQVRITVSYLFHSRGIWVLVKMVTPTEHPLKPTVNALRAWRNYHAPAVAGKGPE